MKSSPYPKTSKSMQFSLKLLIFENENIYEKRIFYKHLTHVTFQTQITAASDLKRLHN